MSEAHHFRTEERKPAWRCACLAYREMRQAGACDQQAHEAAVAAVLHAWQGIGAWHARVHYATGAQDRKTDVTVMSGSHSRQAAATKQRGRVIPSVAI